MTAESTRTVSFDDGSRTVVDLDTDQLRELLARIDRPVRPCHEPRIGTPIAITVSRGELELARTALRYLIHDGDVPEAVRLTATALDVSVQEPLACLRSTPQRLPVTLDVADVAALTLALQALADRSARRSADPNSSDGGLHAVLLDKLRRATTDVGPHERTAF